MPRRKKVLFHYLNGKNNKKQQQQRRSKMQLGNFMVSLTKGTERVTGHVEIEHGTQYGITLNNGDWTRRANAQVSIDGKVIGTYRLYPGEIATLECAGNHDSGKFTALFANSVDGAYAGLDESNPSLGLITVVFTPEKLPEPRTYYTKSFLGSERGTRPISYRSIASLGLHETNSAMGTGLTGASDQQFGTAGFMPLDTANTRTIHLRLKPVVQSRPRPVVAAPAVQTSTPIPPRYY